MRGEGVCPDRAPMGEVPVVPAADILMALVRVLVVVPDEGEDWRWLKLGGDWPSGGDCMACGPAVCCWVEAWVQEMGEGWIGRPPWLP